MRRMGATSSGGRHEIRRAHGRIEAWEPVRTIVSGPGAPNKCIGRPPRRGWPRLKRALGKARADLTTRIVPLGVALLGVGNRRALPGRTCLFENSSLRVPMVQVAVHVLGDLGVPALDEKIESLEEVPHQVVLAGV